MIEPEKASPVHRLHERGFAVGPAVETSCEQGCPHPWGDHLLWASTGNPIEGGLWDCPGGCGCHGTWDVPMAEALRKVLDERRLRDWGSD